MSYLAKICEYKQEELETTKGRVSFGDVRAKAGDQEPARNFFAAVAGTTDKGTAIIAELKKASPSRGLIVADFDPVQIANIYQDNGAAVLSVLTDEHFFQGKLSYIQDVKAATQLPALRKDFTLSEYQIYEARAAQADAVLLIARILEATELDDYRGLVHELGMTSLIEVHDQWDLEKVVSGRSVDQMESCLIGINNRNLESFESDLAVTEELKPSVPEGLSVVSESGIHTRDDVERLIKAGVNIFLIGEALLTAKSIGEKLKELRGI